MEPPSRQRNRIAFRSGPQVKLVQEYIKLVADMEGETTARHWPRRPPTGTCGFRTGRPDQGV
jgi:hypothetical protein